MSCFIRRFLSIQKLKLAFEAPHDQTFLRDVRLVSKRLSDTVTPILFSKFRMSTTPNTPGQRFNHIRMALATEDVSIFPHVKELFILTRPFPASRAIRPWFELLELLIPTLTNLGSVW
jgi:hypothetical protein